MASGERLFGTIPLGTISIVGLPAREREGMRSNLLLAALAFVLGLVVVAALPAPAAPAPDAASIAKLVEQLGSGDFEEREKATKDLDAIGEPALDALRKAAEGHEDAEV